MSALDPKLVENGGDENALDQLTERFLSVCSKYKNLHVPATMVNSYLK